MGGRFFSYVLRSGKSWKGKIGEAVITVDISEVSSFYQTGSVNPDGYSAKGGKLTWVLRDFEPDTEIHVGLEPKWRIWIGGPRGGGPLPIEDPEISGKYRTPMVWVGQLRFLPNGFVSWDAVKRECTVNYRDHSLRMRPGSKAAILNEHEQVNLPGAPYIKRSRLRVPIIAVVEALGLRISRDEDTGSITILEPGEPRQDPETR